MKRLIITIIAFALVVNVFAQTYSDMLERALSSVVTVAVYKTEVTKKVLGFRGDADVAYDNSLDLSNSKSSGSGFIIERNGKKYVITNAHVVEEASSEMGSIYVFTINRNKYEVRILGGDSFYDIAVLEFVETPGTEISTLKIRTTDVRIGEQVFAIGNPLGEYPYTVSDGIISAKNRFRGGTTGKFGFLQTTATVIWGNSGGPLIDAKGDVVGINSQIAFATRGDMSIWQPQINFALESNLSNRLINDILQNDGRVKRAYLGIEVSQSSGLEYDSKSHAQVWQLRDELPVISKVFTESPSTTILADKLGFAITKVNGHEIRNLEEVLGEFEKLKPGENVKLTLSRGTSVQDVIIKAQELNAQGLDKLARSLIETNPSITLASEDDLVSIRLKEAYTAKNQNMGVSSAALYYVLTCGLHEGDYSSLWRIEKLSDLGAAFRLTGLYGFYDIFVINSNNTDGQPEKLRINLSGDDYVRKSTLWY
jgi:S1-C subfamily serine protease